jgi:phosphoglycerate dehydrogenase-like enzyme
MRPDVWIPASTSAIDRRWLEGAAAIHEVPAEGALPSHLGHADLLVLGFPPTRALEAIPSLDGLRVVQSLSAGVDAFVERIPRGITLCDASGVHDVAVAEWCVLGILASLHNLPQYLAAQAQATWERAEPAVAAADLEGATVLILGYGSIGRALEARLAPFGVEFLRVARTARVGIAGLAELPALLPRAEVVVCLLPLTEETRGLVDASVLQAMPPGALFVNASRGAVVETDALVAALVQGQVRAALDVTDPEPLPDGHPLWTTPGCLITPHVAGDVRREPERAWRFVAEQAGRLARGERLRNVVVDGY